MRISTIQEQDYLLVTALQVAPRADWSRIGQVLGVDASTASRRWSRLTEQGLAWMSCYPRALAGHSMLVANMEINCLPGRLRDVALELASDPHVLNVECVTGGRDLMITAVFMDQRTLGHYREYRIGGLDAVTATRTQLSTGVLVEGSRWRLDRLNRAQQDLLRHKEVSANHGAVRAEDLALVQALSLDFRAPAERLAQLTGLSVSTVRRRLERLHVENALSVRCEIARDLSGWPVGATVWASVPPGEIDDVAAELAGRRETRLCATTTGPSNLVIAVWLRTVEHLRTFLTDLTERFPRLLVNDSAVVLWQVKIGGFLLDPGGRPIRPVPVGPWGGAEPG